jgi:hypothetical protein
MPRFERTSTWGYKLDYDREIAEDEKEIARLSDSRLVALIASMTEEERDWLAKGYQVNAYTLLTDRRGEAREQTLRVLGLSRHDLGMLAWYGEGLDDGDADINNAIDEFLICHRAQPQLPNAVQVARQKQNKALLSDLFDNLTMITEAARLDTLKKIKMRLTRHRRNKAKWSGK